jgi:nucleotidyltransferase/DNA polymerase involved in DNA repair
LIACIVVPYFAAALERQVGAGQDLPLLLVEYRGQRGKVAAYSHHAHEMGVERGQSVSRARAHCPQASVQLIDPERYTQARNTLLNLLWGFTNRVEIDETTYPHTATCYLDLGNLNADALTYLSNLMISNLQERMGVTASIGISRGKFVAYIAAQSGRVTLVSQDKEAQFVSSHSVNLLPLNKVQSRRLYILGIRTLGDLVGLPRPSVIAQFGRIGGLLHQLASGLDGRPIKPQRMPEREAVRQQFESLSDRNRLDVRVYQLAEILAEKLAGRGSALHQLTLTLEFEQGKPAHQDMHLFEPVTSSRAIGESVLTLLDRMKAAKPITGIEICASHLVPALPRQLELFTQRPLRQQLVDLSAALAAQYPAVRLYEILPGTPGSLLPERRFTLRRVDAS